MTDGHQKRGANLKGCIAAERARLGAEHDYRRNGARASKYTHS
jgi:hypothetical protein